MKSENCVSLVNNDTISVQHEGKGGSQPNNDWDGRYNK
jgi:hypothetical protein